jgi:hypothetical protein
MKQFQTIYLLPLGHLNLARQTKMIASILGKTELKQILSNYVIINNSN